MLCSLTASLMPPVSLLKGKAHPVPRKLAFMALPRLSVIQSTDENRTHRNHGPNGKIGRIVAGSGSIAIASRGPSVDVDRGAANHYGATVLRHHLKSRPRWRREMRGRVVGGATRDCRRASHDVYIAAQTA